MSLHWIEASKSLRRHTQLILIVPKSIVYIRTFPHCLHYCRLIPMQSLMCVLHIRWNWTLNLNANSFLNVSTYYSLFTFVSLNRKKYARSNDMLMHACIYSICESPEIRLIMIICSGFRHSPLVSSIRIDLLYLQLDSHWILEPIKYLPWKSVNFYGLCRSSLMLWSIAIDSLVPLQSWNGVKLTYLLRTRLMIESNLKCDELTHWEQKWFTLCIEIRIEKKVKMHRKLVNIQRKNRYIQIGLSLIPFRIFLI